MRAWLIGGLLVVLAVLTGVLALAPDGRNTAALAATPALSSTAARIADIPLDGSAAPVVHRPRYRYSVVSGGVADAAEVRQVTALDPVVAAHYRGMDTQRLRVSRVDAPRAVHVSYRVDNNVYWTARKVWLKKGELLLTDGVNELRGRCGNRIAELPAGDMPPMGPPPELLDEEIVEPAGIEPLEAFPLLFPESPVEPLVASPEPLSATPFAFVPTPTDIVVPHVPNVPSITPFTSDPVPEPATWMLIGVGTGLGAARRLMRGRRAARRFPLVPQP